MRLPVTNIPFGGRTPATPLAYAGGLVGEPIPAVYAGDGCRIFNNARLGEGGVSLKTRPGWRRSLVHKLDAIPPLGAGKKIVAFKALDAYGIPGVGVAWVDLLLAAPHRRILALGHNQAIAPEHVGGGWNPSVDPIYILSDFGGAGTFMDRLTAHEYPPRPITFRKRTYFYDKFNVPMTLQGGAMRESVPAQPARKPLLLVAADLNDPCNRVHGSTAAEPMTVAAGSPAPAIVAFKNTFPADYPTWGPNDEGYNEVEIIAKAAGSQLVYRNHYFRFVDAGKPHAVDVHELIGAPQYALEYGRYVYRITYLVSCVEPAVFVGTGSSVIHLGGEYTSLTNGTLEIRIKAVTSDFEWRFKPAGGVFSGYTTVTITPVAFQDTTLGVKVRFESTAGHVVGDLWTFECRFVGESLGGWPSHRKNIGDPDLSNDDFSLAARLEHIPRGALGIFGRRIYRSAPGPTAKIVPADITPQDVDNEDPDDNLEDGLIPQGTHKWVRSFVIPGRGESPHSPIPNHAIVNDSKSIAVLIGSLERCPTFAMFTSAGGTLDDMTVKGHYAASTPANQKDDYLFEIVLATPTTYQWRKNDGAFSVAAALPVSPAFAPLSDNLEIGFSTALGAGRSAGDKWVISRANNNVTQRFYRADDGEQSPQVSEKNGDHGGPSSGASDFRYVGSLDNNYEAHFNDNTPPEKMGTPPPKLEDLKYWLVTTILDNTTETFTDRVRTMNLGTELSKVPQPINHTRIRLYFRLKDNDKKPGSILEANSLALVFAGGKDFFGDLKQIPIDQPIMAGDWHFLDLLWRHGNYEARSFGFQLLKRDKTLTGTVPNPVFQFGTVYVDRGKYGPFTGETQARFTWFDKETDVESDSSNPSAPVDCGEFPSGIAIHPLGYRGFWDKAADAFADDPVGLNLPPAGYKRVKVHAAYLRWGKGEEGQGEFHVATEATYPVVSADTPDDYLARKISIGNKDSPFLGDADTYAIGNTALLPGTPEAQNLTTPEPTEESAARDIKELRIAEPLHDFKGRPRSCELAVLDGDRIVMARESDFDLGGQVTLTKYKDIAVYIPASGDPADKLMAWMEGRLFNIQSADKDYGNPDGHFETRQRDFVIRKVIDATHFLFGSKFDALTQDFQERYYGASGTFDFRIKGNRTSIFWTTKTRLLAANPDYMAVFNEMPSPLANDEITAMGFAGEWLLLWSEGSLYRTIQNRLVLDDDEDQIYTIPEAIHGAPGCIAPRTVVELPGGRVIWFTPDYRIAVGTAGGFQHHEGRDRNRPISQRFQGWLRDNVDPELVRFAHAIYDPEKEWYEIFFIAKDEADNCYEDGTRVDVTIPATDFYHRLTLDMRHDVIYTSDRAEMICSLSASKACMDLGEIPGKILTGDRFGFISEMNPASALSRGSPNATFRYTALSINGPLTIITTVEATLPTAGDGLKDLEIWIQTPAGLEERRILSNTANTMTLYTALAAAPVTLTPIRLGPIRATVRAKENRFIRPGCLESMLLDSQDSNPAVPTTFTGTAYLAEGGKIQGQVTTGPLRSVPPSDFAKPGFGRIWFARKGSRAVTPEISWIQEQAVLPVQIDAAHMFIRHQEEETGRDY